MFLKCLYKESTQMHVHMQHTRSHAHTHVHVHTPIRRAMLRDERQHYRATGDSWLRITLP